MKAQYTDAPRVLSSGCAAAMREGERMPKTKNLGKLKDRFEVRGGIINEFDFHQGQREFAEEERNRLEQREEGQGGPPAGEGQPQSEAERVAQLMEDARRKAEANLRRREKRGGPAPSKAAGKKKAAKKKCRITV